MNSMKWLLPVVAASFVAGSAVGNVSVQQVVDPNVPAGFVANALIWDGGGVNDWTSAVLVVDFTSGSAYQDAFGMDSAPPAAFFPTLPSLEYDTYVGILGDPTGGIAGGSAGCLGCVPLSLDAPQIYITWVNTSTSDTGVVKIGNITLSDDAAGTWSIQTSAGLVEGVVVNGAMVPEPGSLAVMGLGGLGVLRRR